MGSVIPFKAKRARKESKALRVSRPAPPDYEAKLSPECQGVIETLELIANRARRGEVIGVLFALKEPDRWGGIGICGAVDDDLAGAVAAASRAEYTLNKMIDEINASRGA